MKLVMFGGMTVGLLGSAGLQCAASGPPQGEASHQHFVCHTGYTVEKCRKDITVLQRALEKYPVAQLGGVDLGAGALRRLACHSKSTWVGLEQSGVYLLPGQRDFSRRSAGCRSAETLFRSERSAWGMSIEKLLDYAIAHELGHALCNERNEAKADRAAKLMREGNAPSCEVNLQAKR